jgi:V/A-type H+/Na+-transporting ATPase subunit D
MTPRSFSAQRGRAGRLWLMQRLATARKGADLLDRKLRVLQNELIRLQTAAADNAARWDNCQVDADSSLLMAALIGGQREIRLAADDLRADVTIGYATTIGLRYPATATCSIPPTRGWEAPTVAGARRAHATALSAAADYAVAARAVRTVETEVSVTRHRLRAVRDRWIPQLEQALTEVTLAIEELERADAARLRLAMGPAVARMVVSRAGGWPGGGT